MCADINSKFSFFGHNTVVRLTTIRSTSKRYFCQVLHMSEQLRDTTYNILVTQDYIIVHDSPNRLLGNEGPPSKLCNVGLLFLKGGY